MKIIVVSKGPYDVYGGRPGPFGNPFVIGRDSNREQVIFKHDHWLDQGPELVELMRKTCEATGKTEVRVKCFCAPQACHLDNYARRINNGN